MFMEYVNIFGLKLDMMADWFRKNSSSGEMKIAEKTLSFKQHLAIMNYFLKTGLEYLSSLERGKPDDSYYRNINEISEKIALMSEKDNYAELLKQFKINSGSFILKLKSCKNNSSKNLSEYLMDQFLFFGRHFGACEEKLNQMK
jgi:hypothetical protein